MNQEFHAIYEHGVLRPLTPLDLPELAEVLVVLKPLTGVSGPSQTGDSLLGSMAEDAELLDAIVDDAMVARESHPFRTTCG